MRNRCGFIRRAIAQIEQLADRWWEWTWGDVFSGLSLSSILILMALGLSIIFGFLMGRDQHGTWRTDDDRGVCDVLRRSRHFCEVLCRRGRLTLVFHSGGMIPISFVAAGVVGMILEATVIRFLYGRPLETLLATIGVSYILTQLVRVQFGDNIAVNSPDVAARQPGSYEIDAGYSAAV